MNHSRPLCKPPVGLIVGCLLLAIGLGQLDSHRASGQQADAQQADADSPIDVLRLARLRDSALDALAEGKYAAAIKSANEMVELAPDQIGMIAAVSDIYLRAGKVDVATVMFNRYAKQRPDQLPYLWQRGISLYFSGDYDEAARQFEVHRTVNPNDVENAAWHFLCVAKSKSVDKALELVLPAPGDPRVPMQEVLEMLTSGDTEAVKKRVESVPEGTRARRSAEFYGDFYLGLYADAYGRLDEAREYLDRAAKDAPRNYMGDVARVYAEQLKKPPVEK